MCSKFTFLLLISQFVYHSTAPIETLNGDHGKQELRYRRALEKRNLFQGDIVLSKRNRFALKDESLRWPQKTIPYIITHPRKKLKRKIEKAMKHIESKTCIQFVERTTEEDFVNITEGDGCFSNVGRQRGAQEMSIGEGCEPLGTIVHELMHVIGFDHQHNRFDRDGFLNIHWENIDPEEKDQFQKLTYDESIIFTPFDFKSIMLYDSTSFSKNGFSKTMTAKNPKNKLIPVWDKRYLSKSDAYSINKLYNCE